MRHNHWYTMDNPLLMTTLFLSAICGFLAMKIIDYDIAGIPIGNYAKPVIIISLVTIPVMSILAMLNFWYDSIENSNLTDYQKSILVYKTALIFASIGFILNFVYSGMLLIIIMIFPCLILGLAYMPICRICNKWLKKPTIYHDKMYCDKCLTSLQADFGEGVI